MHCIVGVVDHVIEMGCVVAPVRYFLSCPALKSPTSSPPATSTSTSTAATQNQGGDDENGAVMIVYDSERAAHHGAKVSDAAKNLHPRHFRATSIDEPFQINLEQSVKSG